MGALAQARPSNPIAVPCSHCGAEPAKGCRTPSGGVARPHNVRRVLLSSATAEQLAAWRAVATSANVLDLGAYRRRKAARR